MSRDSDTYSLPLAPKDLCFNQNEFNKKTFSADEFLQNHRKKANLEQMRDDLGIYLKILRSAMIELINKDYADFVNLSSNLIGLDKAISGLQTPLGQLREEVLQVKLSLDEAISELTNKLEERRKIKQKKYSLECLSQVHSSFNKLNSLLNLSIENNKNMKIPLDPNIIERASAEFTQLQFALGHCEDYLSTFHKEHSEKICDILMESLNSMFLESVKNKNKTKMSQCLTIYFNLDKSTDVEKLVRKSIIAPELKKIISENTIYKDPNSLQEIYSKILECIEQNLRELLDLTISGERSCEIKGFDFLINSVWPEIEQRIRTNMSLIFAPGNPEFFYKRYTSTIDFLSKFDYYCGTQNKVKQLHTHPQYISFLHLWNLSVYYQIRFQEIAGNFETSLKESNTASLLKINENASGLQLATTEATWTSLNRCWSEGIFIRSLSDRFWKLTLQILSRYHVWTGTILNQKWPSPYQENHTSTISSPSSSSSSSIPKPATQSMSRLDFLVCLFSDIQRLVDKLPELLTLVTYKISPSSSKTIDLLKKSLKETEDLLISRHPDVSQYILGEVSGDSLAQLRQVSDIPRLYRRTNRDRPSKACGYVTQVLAAPTIFYTKHSKNVATTQLKQWLQLIISAITQQYYTSVDDVLTSVQKTEESLRRLKKIRDRSSTTPQSGEMNKGLGDDDKIREQLLLDVQTFCQGVTEVGLTIDQVDKLKDLLNLVETACNNKLEINKNGQINSTISTN